MRIHGGCECSGQRCTAIKVILVMESVADELVKKICDRVAKLKVGNPRDNCEITPVISESSANFIEGLVNDAREKKATFCQVGLGRGTQWAGLGSTSRGGWVLPILGSHMLGIREPFLCLCVFLDGVVIANPRNSVQMSHKTW